MDNLADHSLYAWVGEDEFGSGVIGLKQARVPAGLIPIVVMDYHREKAERGAIREQMEDQARVYGKRIYLVRFGFAEVVAETKAGK